ncbi:hypothetical protein [Halorubrum distributum]|uniref:hypothetical protein n=1 Tax=Halorubrum distributum TaxID=29283 RepID=UPI00139F2C0E|nr:hypothetical protein [Halorubrum terrestre]
MRASEAGAALALQPENEGERTALSRLREIERVESNRYEPECDHVGAEGKRIEVGL